MKRKYVHLLCFLFLFSCCAIAHAQERMLTLDLTKVSLEKALKEVEKQSSMSVVYNTKDVDVKREVTIKVSKATVASVMERLFKGTNVRYSVSNGTLYYLKSALNSRVKKLLSQLTVL